MVKSKSETEIIRSFMVYFDGVPHYVEPVVNVSTYQMGLCDLEYSKGILVVTLRRPGLLIGERGKTINDLEEYLECKIEIVEKVF